jgi:hypothetical protein
VDDGHRARCAGGYLGLNPEVDGLFRTGGGADRVRSSDIGSSAAVAVDRVGGWSFTVMLLLLIYRVTLSSEIARKDLAAPGYLLVFTYL